MISSCCAACKYLRRKGPSYCIFSSHFPPNGPQRFACIYKIYSASIVGKMLQVPLEYLFIMSLPLFSTLVLPRPQYSNLHGYARLGLEGVAPHYSVMHLAFIGLDCLLLKLPAVYTNSATLISISDLMQGIHLYFKAKCLIQDAV